MCEIMKQFFICFFLLFSINSMASYKIISNGKAIKLPPEKSESGDVFVTKGYAYPENEFIILSEDSFEIGSVEDSSVNGGVFYKEYLSGDFIVSFESGAWSKRNSGLLGIVVEREGVLTRLIEVASYSAYGAGCPFTRVFNPYRYNAPVCNFNERYKFTLKKENGSLYSEVRDLSSGRTYQQTITAGESDVQVGVYFVESASSDYDKKIVKNFNVEKL